MARKQGVLEAIYRATKSGGEMESLQTAMLVTGKGIEGDRYGMGIGNFQKGKPWKRQVVLMNMRFFGPHTKYQPKDTRRELFVRDAELMFLIGKDFKLGHSWLRGVKYCDPCDRPGKLSGIDEPFDEAFEDCGGLIADVLDGGPIWVGCFLIPPPKDY